MKRKITVFIAIAAPLAAVLIAGGCGSSASGSAYSAGPYGSAAVASARSATAATRVGVASVLDRKPGQTKGEGLQDFGGGWDVVSPAGKKIESGG
jgi:hypothetical protein